MSYSIEKLTYTLRALDTLPNDVKEIIWQNVLDLEKYGVVKEPPAIRKKHILSKKTKEMMKRWYIRGSKNRQAKKLEFSNIE